MVSFCLILCAHLSLPRNMPFTAEEPAQWVKKASVPVSAVSSMAISRAVWGACWCHWLWSVAGQFLRRHQIRVWSCCTVLWDGLKLIWLRRPIFEGVVLPPGSISGKEADQVWARVSCAGFLPIILGVFCACGVSHRRALGRGAIVLVHICWKE